MVLNQLYHKWSWRPNSKLQPAHKSALSLSTSASESVLVLVNHFHLVRGSTSHLNLNNLYHLSQQLRLASCRSSELTAWIPNSITEFEIADDRRSNSKHIRMIDFGFKGILGMDDIYFDPEMKKWWQEVQEVLQMVDTLLLKYDYEMSKVRYATGTGLVDSK